MNKREMIDEYAGCIDVEMMCADGFDEAIIGVCRQFGKQPVVAYDYQKCIGILIKRDGMSYGEAEEYMDYNVLGAYVGEGTPVFMDSMEQEDSVI